MNPHSRAIDAPRSTAKLPRAIDRVYPLCHRSLLRATPKPKDQDSRRSKQCGPLSHLLNGSCRRNMSNEKNVRRIQLKFPKNRSVTMRNLGSGSPRGFSTSSQYLAATGIVPCNSLCGTCRTIPFRARASNWHLLPRLLRAHRSHYRADHAGLAVPLHTFGHHLEEIISTEI